MVVLAAALAACSGNDEVNEPGASRDVIFLAQTVAPTVVMEALFDGRVVRDPQGCIRLDSNEPATVIWPFGFSVVNSRYGLVVLDDKGRNIGRIGKSFRFGGGYVDSLHSSIALSAADRQRAAACPGQFWIVGDVYSR